MIPVVNGYDRYETNVGVKVLEGPDIMVLKNMVLDKLPLTQQYLGYLKMAAGGFELQTAIAVHLGGDRHPLHPCHYQYEAKYLTNKFSLIQDNLDPNVYWHLAGYITRISRQGTRYSYEYLADPYGTIVTETYITDSHIYFISVDINGNAHVYEYIKGGELTLLGYGGALGKVQFLRNLCQEDSVVYFWMWHVRFNEYNLRFGTYQRVPGNTTNTITLQTYTVNSTSSYYWETSPGAFRETENGFEAYVAVPSISDSGNCGIEILYVTYDHLTQQLQIEPCNINPKTNFIAEMGGALPTNIRFNLVTAFTSDGKLLLTADSSTTTRPQIAPFAIVMSIDATDPKSLSIESVTNFTDIGSSFFEYALPSIKGDKLFFISSGGYYEFQYNPTTSGYTYVTQQTFPDLQELGFDEFGRIWALTNDKQIYLIAPNIPTTLEIRFANNQYIWEGTPIDTNIYVNVWDGEGNRLAKPVELTILSDNAYFIDSSGNKVTSITVNTNTDNDTSVSLTITGPGRVSIDGKIVV